MRSIKKGKEPALWTNHRAAPDATFENAIPAARDALRRALVSEQSGLCCYCMRRVSASPSSMKIEHWLPQSGNVERSLDYRNLLAVCLGNEGMPPRQQHCDTSKGNRSISTHPADTHRNISALFKYSSEGDILSATGDSQIVKDIATLNLNYSRLRAGRKAAIYAIKLQVLKLGAKKALSEADFERLTRKVEEPTVRGLREYCQAQLYWLRRKARAAK